MPRVQVPGTDKSLDPDEITKLEIVAENDNQFSLKLFLTGQEEPDIYTFPTKTAAIDFYNTLWQLRSSGSEDLVVIGDLA